MNTLNAAHRLPFSLASVAPWADEIVVVDMHSEDNTVEIAGRFNARVFLHERLDFVEPARSWAVAQSSGRWVLILDADELVPAELARRLCEIAHRDEADVVVIPWANYLLGRRLGHTGWGPEQDFHPRFFRRGSITPPPEIHAPFEIKSGSRVVHLRPAPGTEIVHLNYTDTADFLARLNRYTSVEATQRLLTSRRSSPAMGLRDAIMEFGRRYVRLAGYRDGWRGFYLSVFMAMYQLVVSAKVVENLRDSSGEAVERRYQAVARQVLSGYSDWSEPR